MVAACVLLVCGRKWGHEAHVARWEGTGWLEATQEEDQAATHLARICREEENN